MLDKIRKANAAVMAMEIESQQRSEDITQCPNNPVSLNQ